MFFLFEENKYVTFVGPMVGPRLTLFVCLFVSFKESQYVNVFVFIVTFVGPMVGPRLTLAPPRR